MMGPKESFELKMIAGEMASKQTGLKVIIIDLTVAEATIMVQKAVETGINLPFLEALAHYHAGKYEGTVIDDDITMQLSFLRLTTRENPEI